MPSLSLTDSSNGGACPRVFTVGQIRRLSFIILGLSLTLPLLFSAETNSVTEVGKLSAEWVKTRLETTRLEIEWKNQRPLLESTVDGLTERAQSLESNCDLLQAKTAKDREELAALTKSVETSVATLQAVEARVKSMTASLLQLRPSLPPRLSSALELSYRSLNDPNLTMSVRMQLNMTVLNRCLQFNRTITCEEEVLDIDNSKNAQVLEVIYWGMSHAYALDRAKGLAWLGAPGSQGWHWEAHPEAALSVAELVSIYHDKADPDFVTVPGKLNHPAGKSAQ